MNPATNTNTNTNANTNANTNNPARFWSSFAGWSYVVSGVGLAVASLVPGAIAAITHLVVPDAGQLDRAHGLYAGIAGGLTAGFGAAMIGIAKAKTLAEATRSMAMGLMVWFVVDTGASLGHGSWQNAIGNMVFFALGLIPLWALSSVDSGPRVTESPRTA